MTKKILVLSSLITLFLPAVSLGAIYGPRIGLWQMIFTQQQNIRQNQPSDEENPFLLEKRLRVGPPKQIDEWYQKRVKEIDTLKEINGVTISEIEKRARPGGYARSGFIGEDESFLSLLKDDAEAMKNLGVTHQWLGEHLIKIIQQAKKERGNKSTVDILYEWKKGEKKQKLRVTYICTRGIQNSIFGNRSSDNQLGNVLNRGWNCEAHIANITEINERIVGNLPANRIPTELKISVGGDVDGSGDQTRLSGVPAYIYYLGFFEGGRNPDKPNPWAFSPKTLYEVITGNKTR